jgi:hypothetical protein
MVRIFFLEIGQYGYQKSSIFMLIQKMQTYLRDKLHLKKSYWRKTLPILSQRKKTDLLMPY